MDPLLITTVAWVLAVTPPGPEPAPPRVLGFSREEYLQYARQHPGDPARGRALFFDPQGPGCARCHRVRGEGGAIGPDLSDVGGKYERALLIESVLEPSRQIVDGYRPAVIATALGRVFSGIVKDESAEELVIVDDQGARHVVQKSEIEQRMTSQTSVMPAGPAAGLSPRDLADLTAYMEGLRSAGQGTPGSGMTGPIALPPGFSSDRIAAGLTGATALAVAPDGRAFCCEQTGTLRVVTKGGTLLPKPFVTVQVDSSWERGLIGVALDPRFVDNGHVYVCYVTPRPYVHHRISRFTARGDVAPPGCETVLFEGDDQAKLGGSVPAGHQGGAIHFGKDGKLYAALGDQTAGAPAQMLTTLQGKLLRLNPDGSIPQDNPFYRTARGKYRAIWALGLRNPFTFAVQPGTGRIFINDVGEGTWEEVNEGVAGANHGWPATEGPTSDSRFRGPIHHYPVASIAGGAFCPPIAAGGFPRRYQGKYFFMDFVRGWIKVLDPDHPERVETFAAGLTRPVDLAFGPDGSLFVLLRDAWVVDGNFRSGTGSLLRIRPEPMNGEPPRVPISGASAGVFLRGTSAAGPRRADFDLAQDQPKAKVAAPDNANEKPVDDPDLAADKAIAEFLTIYRLAPGQDLKRLDPPRPAGASAWWNRKFGINAGAGPEQYGAMIFRWRDPDHLENFGALFGPATSGYPLRNLPDSLGMEIDPAEIDGDAELLKMAVSGDWVFREGVPAGRMAGLLESILQRALRKRIKLTFRQVERDVVVARGRYHYAPLPGRSKNQVDLYGKQLVKDGTVTGSSGDFGMFLRWVGGFIGRPIVSEVDAPPKEPISWFTHVRSPFTERMHREDHDETLVLQHLREQTGLTFTRERKPIRVLFIEPAK